MIRPVANGVVMCALQLGSDLMGHFDKELWERKRGRIPLKNVNCCLNWFSSAADTDIA